ncbi:undecaprenyl-diphosphatase [Actinopolymorpha cephalotaxi]|uniref:Undecaprenyl-diphosphatase n=1 Tax=Actinopolymorpha cephalotaxi TaxID=504797 RepID=A0A1I2ZLH4_9ACTN|nr:bifunctional DedA family/phosphatase PAP2 family protein [Actinopolymorpha cephalotaxi]NYH82068.1 undecaprenyl-diphosphatase [Actinopolymorpha cephalotaxi]SFH38678.1 undecaprenyl-diphosphatase [Actinopolymorpha cephalotaxi]
MINTVASYILALPAWVALVVVFALPALESSAFVGFVFPGEIALILGGVLAYEGRVGLAAVLIAGIGGAVVGDSVGYLVGRRYGRRLLEGTLGKLVNHKHFDRAERYLAERGGKAVFLGRFTAALRVMIPGLSGMARMRYPKFAAFNIAGGVAWGAMCVLLGYLGGSSWRHVEHLASRIGLGVLAVVIVLAVAGYLLRRASGGWWRRQGERIRESRPATWVMSRFPGQVDWVVARLDASATTGLALTVSVVVAVGSTWAFLGITQDVLAHEEFATIDPTVHTWVLHHRVAWLNDVLRVVTWLGSNTFLLPGLAIAAIVLVRQRRSWGPVVAIVASYGSALLVHAVVREWVHRARPPSADWLSGAGGWSYPSGHTIQATVAWGIVAILALSGVSARTRPVVASAAAGVVLLVAASRIYLGVHWPTDVLASLALGVGLLSLYGIARLAMLARREVAQEAEQLEPA